MMNLSPESYAAFQELQSTSFNYALSTERITSPNRITFQFDKQHDGYFYRDSDAVTLRGQFIGHWEFGSDGKVWVEGNFSGTATEYGLSWMTLNELEEVQHLPFINKVNGLRMGGYHDGSVNPSYRIRTSTATYIGIDRAQIYDNLALGEENIYMDNGSQRTNPIYTGRYQTLSFLTGTDQL